MKKPLFILAILFSLHAKAQTSDSVFNLLRIQNARLDTIQLNLHRFSNQYHTGTVGTIIGGMFAVGSGLIYAFVTTKDSKTGETLHPTGALLGIGLGAGLITIGSLIQIDAHKWIRKAGKIKRK